MGLDLLAANRPEPDTGLTEEAYDEYVDATTTTHIFRIGYGGFMVLRRTLAWAEGIDLELMDGYRESQIANRHIGYPRQWFEVETELKPLLNHSDCDGQLTPEEVAQIAPRLREIANSNVARNSFRGEDIVRLADAIEDTARKGLYVWFR